MKNIVFYARLVKGVSYICITAAVISFFIKWLLPTIILDNPYHIFNLFLAYTLDDFSEVAHSLLSMPMIHRIMAMVVDSGVSVLLVMILWNIIEVMKKFERNELFSNSLVNFFVKMNTYAFCLALYVPLNRMILSVIITLHNAPGHRILTASFGSADLFNILMFGIFMVMTILMQQATALQNEHNLTV